METSLVVELLALPARKVKIIPDDMVFHSDRGSRYLSGKFQRTLFWFNIRQSVRRTGTAIDNALTESIFAFL